MENLDKALAELAEKFGVHSDEFVTWLTNGGLQAYAIKEMIYNGIVSVFFFIGILISIFGFVYAHRHSDEMDPDFIVVGSTILFVISIVFFLVYFPSFICWIVSPEGMIVDLVLNRLCA